MKIGKQAKKSIRMATYSVIVLLAILALFILFTTTNLFYLGPSGSFFVSEEFSKIEPIVPETWFNASDQKMTASFANSKNNTIRITEIHVNETTTNVTCIVSEPSGNVSIGPGEKFIVHAVCEGANKKEWDKLEISVRIGYEEKVNYEGRIFTNYHVDDGILKGLAEA